MKAGARILIPDGHGAYQQTVFVVEEFRHCLGIFESDDHRGMGRFTPLCELFELGPESEQSYMANIGEYHTNLVQAWIDVP